jgi:acetyl-CoA carboxylase carboxyl transferase subunit beta
MSEWYKRPQHPVKTSKKKEIPDGVWVQCPSCGESLFRKELERLHSICSECGHHFRVSSSEYVTLLLDTDSWTEHDTNLTTADPLGFEDSMRYSDRAVKYIKKSGMNEALKCLSGTMNDKRVELSILDFGFMGGSVGSVVGEKLCRSIDRAIQNRSPLIVVSCSGGMRMQEGLFSLMQMAKASAMLGKLSEAKLPFISVMTNPTTGGTTASFAMLGDINISEPAALIGFAGPRVIKQTIGQDLPKGFQSAEFVLEKGFLDMIVVRTDLKGKLTTLLDLLIG